MSMKNTPKSFLISIIRIKIIKIGTYMKIYSLKLKFLTSKDAFKGITMILIVKFDTSAILVFLDNVF